VQAQLAENRRRMRERRAGPTSLLQGLVVCGMCGYSFHGRTVPSHTAGRPSYGYYRCNSCNAMRRLGLRACPNASVHAPALDDAVWAEVCTLLRDPSRLEREYWRRLENASNGGGAAAMLPGPQQQCEVVERGIARLIDSYAAGLIDKDEFEPRVTRLKQRAAVLAEQARTLRDAQTREAALRVIITQYADFAQRVNEGLDSTDIVARRDIIRAVVRRIEVDAGQVRIIFRVGPSPFVRRPGRGDLPHCPRRADHRP
jgi:site-specific DNA recombinase